MKLIKKDFTDKYRKKWNIYMNDFVQLTDDNGKLLNDSIYRCGGFFNLSDLKDNYFMLLKHVEAFYEDDITKDKLRKPHLESRWCIIDKNGIEKKEFSEFSSVYLRKNTIIYSVNGKYYNAETDEYYGDASEVIDSKNYLILENRWEKDENLRGVFKINKQTGIKEKIDNI